jgi:Domain of unknown function (DUF4249)
MVTGQLDPDYEGDRLAVSGFLSTDSIWLQAGKTVDANKEHKIRDLLAPGTQVFVLDADNKRVAEVFSKDGYNFCLRAKVLRTEQPYKVVVTAPGLLEAETDWIIIPGISRIDSLQVSDLSGIINGPTAQLRVGLRDQDNRPDYYFAGFRAFKKNAESGVLAWVIDDTVNEKCYRVDAFSDACFNGNAAVLLYGFDKTAFFGNSGSQKMDYLRFRFGKVSRQYFDALQNTLEEDGFIQGIHEPPLTYTNVKNGYGVVFGQSWKDYWVKIE